ncbi:MAG: PAS domain S-box protein [Verrucomicrobia bacterium]|nr:PAS domain S-box protein [Verrucomicrobiota bacterium]
MKELIRIKIIAAFGLALAVLVFTGGVTYRATIQFVAESRQVSHAHEVKGQLEELMSSIKEVESATRGYLLTDSESFLDPYRRAMAAVVPQIQRLRALTNNDHDPDQRRRFEVLGGAIMAKLTQARQSIEVRRTQGLDAARRLAETAAGNQQMEKIRQLVEEMKKAEDQLLLRRSRISETGAQHLKQNVAVVVSVAVLLLALAAFYIDRDLARRKQAETALQRQKDLYEALLKAQSNLGEGVGLIEVQTQRLLHVNDALCNIYGFTQAELAALPSYFDLVAPEERALLRERLSQRLSGQGVPNRYETIALHKNGARIPVEVVVKMIEGEGDARLMVLTRDITERKQAEAELQKAHVELELRVQARTAELARANALLQQEIAERKEAAKSLRQSEERKGAILQAALDCIITIDQAGKIVEWNPAAERTFGHPRSDVLGKEMAGLIIPEPMRELHRRGLARYLTTNVGPVLGKRIELTALRADGSEFPVELTISRIGSEPPPKFTAFLRDISDRKQAEEALQRAHDELETRVAERTVSLQREVIVRRRAEAALETAAAKLERSNRELQDFASVASHDLQEPLRKIISYGDLLKEQTAATLTETDRDYLARMQNAAKRMQLLINDLLTFSRVTTLAQSFVPVDLETVAREVVSDLEMRLQETGGRVELEKLPTIDADPMQMRQLLQNLIGNALKFHRDGESPTVRVRSELVPGTQPPFADPRPVIDRCQILVEDNGIGFDEKYLDRIFTVFQRLHGRGTYEGTGMGLAICRKITERHGGEITAKSVPGQGATFVVTLPVKQARVKTSNE